MSPVAAGRTRAAAWALWTLLALLVVGGWSGTAAAQQSSVLRAEARGPVTPVLAEHLKDAVATADVGGHVALVVAMDTPGGLDVAMRDIIQSFLAAPVPVVVYVSPSGGRAASAGAIIAFSAHVAAMAPGTNIGAATPIDLEGGEVIDKIIEDSSAYVAAIAEARDRDVDFAVATVREGRSVPASEAVEVGAVDLVAPSLDVLLSEIDGLTVTIDSETEVTLETDGASVTDYEMSFARRILQTLADPNLAFLFLSIGTLGIIYELASPGGIIGGTIGAVMVIMAFFSLAVLPVDLTGVLLLLLALALFAAELFAPGVGVFAGAGAIALVFAGLFLFQQPTGIGVDLTFLIPVALAVAVAALVLGRYAVRTLRTEPYAGQGGEIVGSHGTVREWRDGGGWVLVNGQRWQAAGPDDLAVGDAVQVTAMEGLRLTVEREDAEQASAIAGEAAQDHPGTAPQAG